MQLTQNKRRIFPIAVLLLAVVALLLPDAQISPSELLGRSKEEVICLLFEKSEKTKGGEVRIAIAKPNNAISNHYFKKPLDAKNNASVMGENVWLCFFAKGFFKIKTSFYKIKFTNGRAGSAELKSHNTK